MSHLGKKKQQIISTAEVGNICFMCSAPLKLDPSFIHRLHGLLFPSSVLWHSHAHTCVCPCMLSSIKSSFCSAGWTPTTRVLLAVFALDYRSPTHLQLPSPATVGSSFSSPSHNPVPFLGPTSVGFGVAFGSLLILPRQLWLFCCWEVHLGCCSAVCWQCLAARADIVTLYYRTNYPCY